MMILNSLFTPFSLLFVVLSYFFLLLIISYLGNRGSTNLTFFNANRQSKWYWVAFGMVGATLSGVTFISVPGEVLNSGFTYFQFVIGNFVGYLCISLFILPYFYKSNVLSIYSVLGLKLGDEGEKTASVLFIISKLIGAAFRLFLAAGVIHMAIFEALNIPFFITVSILIALIWLYTFRGGIKTIVLTDVVQTLFLLVAAIATIIFLLSSFSFEESSRVVNSGFKSMFDWDWKSSNFFVKQFMAGIVITVAINGLDQDIMQKNMTCKNQYEARKNMIWFSFIFVVSVLVFLIFGKLMYYYSDLNGVLLPVKTDQVFPFLALKHFPSYITILFLVGISAAAFSSADSALTSLTTSFCVDILKVREKEEGAQKKVRMLVHMIFAILLLFVIVLFYYLNDESVVVSIFKFAGYTYGPIVGLYLLAFLLKVKVRKYTLIASGLLAPIITFFMVSNSEKWLWGYQFGFEIIILNASIFVLSVILMSKSVSFVKNS